MDADDVFKWMILKGRIKEVTRRQMQKEYCEIGRVNPTVHGLAAASHADNPGGGVAAGGTAVPDATENVVLRMCLNNSDLDKVCCIFDRCFFVFFYSFLG